MRSEEGVGLGEYLADMQRRDLVSRIWEKDASVWREDPAQQVELAGRLGWLTVTEAMRREGEELEGFAEEVRQAGVRHVVLLGMGGSSLGGEVFRQSFGSRAGYPELLVLDSTVPAAVGWVTAQVDPVATLFLLSSKSGSTIETLSGYRHFRRVLEETESAAGGRAGEHFVAITDAGSPLEALARRDGFRRIFLNPPDVGGRYSVLSYFGLVPAALIGMDLKLLLERADRMREQCASVATQENPGAWLGASMGALARRGLDKLTLLISPAIASFGLWAEQLIAESTGKDGQGLVPVAGEPQIPPTPFDERGDIKGVLSKEELRGVYGPDRQFIFLRLEGDDNAGLDNRVQALEDAGQPMVYLRLQDRYDLGAEFFRWEFATAVAGALIGIDPFNEPDVQRSKDITNRALEAYRREGGLPLLVGEGTLPHLLSQAEPGDYFSAMAYIRQTPETDGLLYELRRRVLAHYPIATMVGYGPRYLHSTGQLHKGGPSTGLYLLLTADHPIDIPIPGQPYSFGVLVAAQAIGDMAALQSLGRRVVRIHLGTDPVAGLRRLVDELK